MQRSRNVVIVDLGVFSVIGIRYPPGSGSCVSCHVSCMYGLLQPSKCV